MVYVGTDVHPKGTPVAVADDTARPHECRRGVLALVGPRLPGLYRRWKPCRKSPLAGVHRNGSAPIATPVVAPSTFPRGGATGPRSGATTGRDIQRSCEVNRPGEPDGSGRGGPRGFRGRAARRHSGRSTRSSGGRRLRASGRARRGPRRRHRRLPGEVCALGKVRHPPPAGRPGPVGSREMGESATQEAAINRLCRTPSLE